MEVRKIFADFVPPVSVHVESVRTWSTFVQPLQVIEVGSEVTKEDGDLEGVLEVGVPDVESIKGPGRDGAGVEDFIASSLRGQRELEGVKTFASGSKRGNALLRMRHQQA